MQVANITHETPGDQHGSKERVVFFPQDILFCSSLSHYATKVFLLNIRTKKIINSFEPGRTTLSALSPNDVDLLLGDQNQLSVWDCTKLKKKQDIPDIYDAADAVFVQGNDVVAIPTFSGELYFYDIRANRLIDTKISNRMMLSVAFSKQHHLLATPFKEGITIWDSRYLKNKTPVTVLQGCKDALVQRCQFHRYQHSTLVASYTKDSSLWTWDITKGEKQGQCIYKGVGTHLDTSPNNFSIYYSNVNGVGTVDQDFSIRLTGEPGSIQISPSGKYLAVGLSEGVAHVYNTDKLLDNSKPLKLQTH